MSPSIYGIDLAKHFFTIHGEDANGNTLIHKTISRAKVLTFFVNLRLPLSEWKPAAVPITGREN
ncbi:hypothetical protein [Photobacterium aquae]|uniref:hypothetical protein n=1 Tax=Photobacterium aquae TaxID=1195763 RepID=UPI0012EE1162|nr:hypothetical protein [Photobacterium aquae]